MVTCGWSKTLTGLCGAIDFFFNVLFHKMQLVFCIGFFICRFCQPWIKSVYKILSILNMSFLTVLPKFCTSHKCPTCPPSLILALLMTGPAVQCTEKKIWSYIIFHFVCGHLYVGILYNTLNSFKGKDHNRVHIILITFTACLFIDRV